MRGRWHEARTGAERRPGEPSPDVTVKRTAGVYAAQLQRGSVMEGRVPGRTLPVQSSNRMSTLFRGCGQRGAERGLGKAVRHARLMASTPPGMEAYLARFCFSPSRVLTARLRWGRPRNVPPIPMDGSCKWTVSGGVLEYKSLHVKKFSRSIRHRCRQDGITRGHFRWWWDTFRF